MPVLGHVILFVSDLATSVAFYRDVAGLEHRFTEAGYAEFGTGATRFALYELQGGKAKRMGTTRSYEEAMAWCRREGEG